MHVSIYNLLAKHYKWIFINSKLTFDHFPGNRKNACEIILVSSIIESPANITYNSAIKIEELVLIMSNNLKKEKQNLPWFPTSGQ